MSPAAPKSVAIVQSNYLPWKGYFDLINSVDEFILYDDRQYTRRDWRSRNRVKTENGVIWLSIPVHVKGRYFQRIDETEVSDREWTDRHHRTLVHAYARAPYFDRYRETLQALYEHRDETRLSAINRHFIETICGLLGIGTKLSWSTDYVGIVGDRTERLVNLCRAAGATTYLSGPAARAYLDELQFERAGIEVRYMDYTGYPEYEQLYPPFEHAVSVIDLLVHTGPDAPRYLKSFSYASSGRHVA